MAGITLGQAVQAFIREIGCPDDRTLIFDRVREAIEWLLFNGGGDILHEWKIPVRKGKTTLPPSLETPVKYKFENCASGGFGTFVTPYSSYSSIGVKACYGYSDWDPLFELKANKVPTQYEAPPCRIRCVATSRNCKDFGKKISVAGKYRGMAIAPTHYGHKTAGEILTVYGEDDPQKKLSAFYFNEITEVVKDLTTDYIMLSGVDDLGNNYFLSHYHPDEEVCWYRQIDLFTCPTFQNYDRNCDFILYVLGRVNPSIKYIREEDIIPISSFEILKLLAKRAKYDESNDFDKVNQLEQRLRIIIKKNVVYSKAPGSKILQNLTMSGGTQKNV